MSQQRHETEGHAQTYDQTYTRQRSAPKLEAPARQLDVNEEVGQLARGIANHTDDSTPWGCRLRYIKALVECMEGISGGAPSVGARGPSVGEAYAH